MATPAEELLAELETLKQSLTDAEEAHEELTKSLEAQYEESNANLDKLKGELKPRMKKLRAATATATADTPAKEEL
jgi:chromosome segregation ATPase